jgi:pyruvate formate lyase activating enzyme
MTEAILYEKLKGNKVRCSVCRHRCQIDEGARGYCKTRHNKEGMLYTLTYGLVTSLHANPIEQKPFFHFFPGTHCFSLGSFGCNFRCPGCQNWELSRAEVEDVSTSVYRISPEDSVELTFRYGCTGISWTFNEPTLWLEYTIESARYAKKRGLYTAYVTNGFITPEGLELLGPYLDAFRVDIKAFSEDTYRRISSLPENALPGVLDSTVRARHQYKMHVECVTNVTPGINDGEDELRGLACWIKRELGPETPWHVTRFYPCFHLSHVPMTSLKALEKIQKIGFDSGLHHVYLGNVPGHPGENSHCSGCGKLLIERKGFQVIKNRILDGRCPDCLTPVHGVFST